MNGFQVIGIDISPHMIPEDQPNNLDLQIDDLNNRLVFYSSPQSRIDSLTSGLRSRRAFSTWYTVNLCLVVFKLVAGERMSETYFASCGRVAGASWLNFI